MLSHSKWCSAELPLRVGLIHCVAAWQVYIVSMSLALNRSSALYCFYLGPATLVSCPARAPLGEKLSGKWSRISWAYSPKQWKTNEIARSLIITQYFPYNFKIYSSPFKYSYFFEWVFHKIFWTLLGYTVTKAPASPRNLTWFTRPFLSWEGGVWGRDYCHLFLTKVIQLHTCTCTMHW